MPRGHCLSCPGASLALVPQWPYSALHSLAPFLPASISFSPQLSQGDEKVKLTLLFLLSLMFLRNSSTIQNTDKQTNPKGFLF